VQTCREARFDPQANAFKTRSYSKSGVIRLAPFVFLSLPRHCLLA
jgi:hypothetical protein